MLDPSAQRPTPWSIYEDLVNLGPGISLDDRPKAMRLIILLLQTVSQDACNAVRHTQQLYRLSARARDVATDIDGLINQVIATKTLPAHERTVEVCEKTLQAHDKYTSMIGPLEE